MGSFDRKGIVDENILKCLIFKTIGIFLETKMRLFFYLFSNIVFQAFAKLYGSYAAIEGGMPIESMVDLTGGLAERYALNNVSETELYDYIRRSFSANAFITCSRRGDWRQAHASDVNGLVQGHAYTITGVYRLYLNEVLCHLVRVRNPWGDNNEWKGKMLIFCSKILM